MMPQIANEQLRALAAGLMPDEFKLLHNIIAVNQDMSGVLYLPRTLSFTVKHAVNGEGDTINLSSVSRCYTKIECDELTAETNASCVLEYADKAQAFILGNLSPAMSDAILLFVTLKMAGYNRV